MLDIVYQDKDLVVCVKPFRVLSTDEPGGMPDLIREALGRPHEKIRTVHRLDQVVGGLMVYARTAEAAGELSRQIRAGSFAKDYEAVVHWRPRDDAGTFRDLLGRDERKRRTYVAKEPGKGVQEAVLHYEVLANRRGHSLVRIALETGRTHQIRVQFASRGMPLAGDRKYSKYPDPEEWEIALWSYRLDFAHPTTGERMVFTMDPPETEPWKWFVGAAPR